MKKYLLWFLLVLALGVRLYQVNSPLIGFHSWRQADTAAIARNFYENGYKFLYPQVDCGGASAGYVETEFPIYSFTVALSYKFSGVQEFWGRVWSVIFSLLTIYFLYLLAKKFIDPKTAFWSALFFSFLPLNIYYSRTFMPESAMLLCSVLGVYLFSWWLDSAKLRYFFLSLIFTALACLLKIPTLYLGLPLFYLAWLKFGKKVFLQWTLWVYAILVFLSLGLWYYHAHQIYLQYGVGFNIWGEGPDKWRNWDLGFSFKFWNKIFFKNLAERYLTWFGFPILVVGLFLKRENKAEKLFDFWLLALLVYLLIVAKANFVHEYYQLPLMLPAAVFMGKVYARHWDSRIFQNKKSLGLTVFLVGTLVLGGGRYHSYMKKENPQSSETFQLAKRIKQKIDDKALVVAVDSGNSTLLYLCHKKGWHSFPGQIDENFLNDKIQKGAKYLVGLYGDFEEVQQPKLKALLKNFEVLLDDGSSFIVKLRD